MIFYGESNLGKIRKNNEDSFLIKEIEKGIFLFIIADGMGGYNKGEFASKVATFEISGYIERKVSRNLKENKEIDKKELNSIIAKAVEKANEYIFSYASTHEDYAKMGTTVIMGLAKGSNLAVANVGDSRLYVSSGKKLKQITLDNSYIQELIIKGIITKEEARNHDDRNIILRAVGTEEIIEVDIYNIELQIGDRLLFCTDGLTDMIDDLRINEIINSYNSPKDSVRELIKEANKAGGVDNITVVVADYLE